MSESNRIYNRLREGMTRLPTEELIANLQTLSLNLMGDAESLQDVVASLTCAEAAQRIHKMDAISILHTNN